jgi:hypothetical protein
MARLFDGGNYFHNLCMKSIFGLTMLDYPSGGGGRGGESVQQLHTKEFDEQQQDFCGRSVV